MAALTQGIDLEWEAEMVVARKELLGEGAYTMSRKLPE